MGSQSAVTLLSRWWPRKERQGTARTEPVMQRREPSVMRATPEAMTWASAPRKGVQADDVFKAASFPPGVAPAGTDGKILAMDAACGLATWGAGCLNGYNGVLFGATNYAILAEEAQRPEYRKVIELIATEMTRKWIKVQATGSEDEGEDKTKKVAELEDELDRLKVKDVYRKGIEQDGFFGRAHIFPDLGDIDGPELLTDIGDGRSAATTNKITKGSLRGVRNVEPMWVYPQNYNTNNPLSPDWYRPQQWLVMGKPVHRSRLLTIVSREVPDILKPAYQFGGLSLIQMLRDYVENFVRTRQSVSDLIHSFSVSGLKTDLQTMLANPALLAFRAQLFNEARDNRGMMLLNKDTEEFFNVTTPLGTLDHLQAQSQEQIASIASTPLVKLFGIQPTGLNASSEGELQCWQDWVHSGQEAWIAPSFDVIFAMAQINIWGEVDPDITYKFEPLEVMNEKEVAEIQGIMATTGETLINAGVISAQEERQRVSAEEDSPYSLDLSLVPTPPVGEEEAEGLLETGTEADPHEEGATHHGGPEDLSDVSLNGAQVSSMIDVVAKIAAGELTLESGRAILLTAFPVSEATVDRILSGSRNVKKAPEPATQPS